VERGKHRALLIATVDGVDAARSPLAPAFAAAGFTATLRGLLRRGPGEHSADDSDDAASPDA
jgi:hypothetical protein